MTVTDPAGSPVGTTAQHGRFFELWPEVQAVDATGEPVGSIPRTRAQATPWRDADRPCRFLDPEGAAVGEVAHWVFPAASAGPRSRAALRLEFADPVDHPTRLLLLAAVIGRETAGTMGVRY